MQIDPNSIVSNNLLLNDFAKRQRDKTIAYLQGHYSLSPDDCEDIFQESFIILFNNIKDGKLDNLTSSVSTYFIAICRNKTMEFLRSRGKSVASVLDIYDGKVLSFQDEKIETILALDTDDKVSVEEKESLVRKIVRDLPSPCDELLWGYYRDGLSMKVLADKFNYASENAVKVTKHRCCEKFRNRFSEIHQKLF